MSPWPGPLYAAAALLVVAGLPKVWSPDATARALRSVGWPGQRLLVRAGGLTEAVLGGLAIGTGSWWAAAAVAVSYLAFSGFVLLALHKGGVLSSCGCFGQPDTPPTVAHLVVTLVLAAGAAAAAADPVGSPAHVVRHTPWLGVPVLAAAAAIAAFGYLALAVLPRLVRAGERSAA